MVSQAYDEKKDDTKKAKVKKLQDSKSHDQERENLFKRLGAKEKKISIDISSGESNKSSDVAEDDNESSTDDILDNPIDPPLVKRSLSKSPLKELIQSREPIQGNFTLELSNQVPSDTELDELLAGINSDHEFTLSQPVKKTPKKTCKKTTKKQKRQRQPQGNKAIK